MLNCIFEDNENAKDCACTGSLDLEETPSVENVAEEVADVIASVEEDAVMLPPEAVDDDICMDEFKVHAKQKNRIHQDMDISRVTNFYI